jgi:hypothetical protein
MDDYMWTTASEEMDNEIVRIIQERERMREEPELVELSGRIGSIADTTEIETINDDEARILLQEQRRRLAALQEQVQERTYENARLGQAVEGWQGRTRQERNRILRGNWPEGDKKSDFDEIFRYVEEDKDKILKPLPDELFEI